MSGAPCLPMRDMGRHIAAPPRAPEEHGASHRRPLRALLRNFYRVRESFIFGARAARGRRGGLINSHWIPPPWPPLPPLDQMPGAVDESMEFQFPCAMDVRNAHPAAQPAAHQPDVRSGTFLCKPKQAPLHVYPLVDETRKIRHGKHVTRLVGLDHINAGVDRGATTGQYNNMCNIVHRSWSAGIGHRSSGIGHR